MMLKLHLILNDNPCNDIYSILHRLKIDHRQNLMTDFVNITALTIQVNDTIMGFRKCLPITCVLLEHTSIMMETV